MVRIVNKLEGEKYTKRPASKVINYLEKGEKYEFPKAGVPYYKSLNPYYK